MVDYEFYGDSSILGLSVDGSAEVFIDLDDVRNVSRAVDDDEVNPSIPVAVSPEDVGGLFGAHGCAEQCPRLEEELE
jgi:hypothetical protein